MEQAIHDGKIDCIVCRDLSRFSRNYIEAGRYLEKIFPQLNIRFIAINDSYDNVNGNIQSDSFIVPFKNLINGTYCKDISVKIRSSLDVKRRKGEYVGAFTPYGYRKDENNRNQLVVDEYAGEIVRFIFTMYKDGVSIGAIADRLNSMGVLYPMEYKHSQGSNFESVFKAHETARWSYLAVRRILTAQVYIGDLVQGKTGTPDYKARKLMKKDPSEWIIVEDAHEPLISHSDFPPFRPCLRVTAVPAAIRKTQDCSPVFCFAVIAGNLWCERPFLPQRRSTSTMYAELPRLEVAALTASVKRS